MSGKKPISVISAVLTAFVFSVSTLCTYPVFADETANGQNERLEDILIIGGEDGNENAGEQPQQEKPESEKPAEEQDNKEEIEIIDEITDDSPSEDISDDSSAGVKTPAEELKLKTKKNITIEAGKRFRITAELVPSNSDDYLIYKTSDKNVLAVTEDGIVTAVGVGKAYITVKTTSGKKAKINVTVTKSTTLPLMVNNMSLRKGKTAVLEYTLIEDDPDVTVSFHSSDKSVASVDQNGKITAEETGSAVITVKTSSGLSAYCNVTVYNGTYRGIDVSKWQKNISWKKVSVSGVDFAMIRASYGDEDVDAKLARNVAGCEKYGIPYGFYHYTYAKTTAEAKKEAKFFLKTIKKYNPEFPIVLDIEESMYKKMSQKKVTNIIRTFMKEFEGAGYYAMIYSYADFFTKYTQMDKLKDYDIWVACWGDKAKLKESYKYHYGMWQRSSKGKVTGISGTVDLDYAYYNYPSRIRKAGLNNLE